MVSVFIKLFLQQSVYCNLFVWNFLQNNINSLYRTRCSKKMPQFFNIIKVNYGTFWCTAIVVIFALWK